MTMLAAGFGPVVASAMYSAPKACAPGSRAVACGPMLLITARALTRSVTPSLTRSTPVARPFSMFSAATGASSQTSPPRRRIASVMSFHSPTVPRGQKPKRLNAPLTAK
ncbi:hypothetical protein D3C86_1733790 [compost metagenome]